MSAKVTVVGAGFSGLSLAYQLSNLGFEVEILERGPKPGGMIATERSEWGLAECAANALLADQDIEDLFNSLDVPFAPRKRERKNRYVYWNGLTRWPLSVGTSLKLLITVIKAAMGRSEVFPRPAETVQAWSRRVVNQEFDERLLGPALQGVYAGRTDRLSASLTVNSLLLGGGRKGKWKGSVAPQRGMSQLVQALNDHLVRSGVRFFYGTECKLNKELSGPTVICTSAWSAAGVVANFDHQLAELLRGSESIPLVSVTMFFEPHAKDPQGFGCLFPTSQNLNSSGVLFNTGIFEGRSKLRSETWILSGILSPDLMEWNDSQIRQAILKDRETLSGLKADPLYMKVNRWPRAIPYYSTEWEQTLSRLNVQAPLFLHGNYLGGIGLAKIYQRSIKLAREIQELYG